MALIKPFEGIIYNSKKSKDITVKVAPPYDVIKPKLQTELYVKDPDNIIRIILIKNLKFAWKAIRHVKSNGIILVKNQSIIGLGTGQPNRINSIEIASKVAGEKSNNSVLASDAFFPFADNVQLAESIGVKSIIQPGGSIRDPEVIDLANKLNISMIFTGTRHFKH